MRLLRADTENLELEEVPDGSKRYAILSHRWLPASEEITYSDIVKKQPIGILQRKLGWKKLDWCRQQAVRDGLEYVWADTACIDKSSSQELTESINAMYKWYHEADVCYVYLHDMPDPLPVLQGTTPEGLHFEIGNHDNMAYSISNQQEPRTGMKTNRSQRLTSQSEQYPLSQQHGGTSPDELTPLLQQNNNISDLEAALSIAGDVASNGPMEGVYIPSKALAPWNSNLFARSEWFTRAWTLQELLASSKLRFYNKSWILIGDLSELVNDVAKVTAVHKEALTKQRPLNSFSIAQKISWAAMRKSTKVEDRAYSLLGLMNISMSIVYGEGEQAFVRFQEELLRVFPSDDSIFAFRRGGREVRMFSDSPRKATSLLATSPDAFNGCSKICFPVWRRRSHEHQLTSTEVVFHRAYGNPKACYLGMNVPLIKALSSQCRRFRPSLIVQSFLTARWRIDHQRS